MDAKTLRRRLDVCLAKIEDLLAGKEELTEEDWKYYDVLKARCDRLLETYRSCFITKAEADRRSGELIKQLERAGHEITVTFCREWLEHSKKPEVRTLKGSDWIDEFDRVWRNVVEGTFSELPFNIPEGQVRERDEGKGAKKDDISQEQTKVSRGNEQAKETSGDADCKHSEDFTSVIWFGQRYDFNKTQALCIGLLWAEWEKGELGLSEKTIGDKIESEADNYKLKYTFRSRRGQHPAWGTMIQACGKGIFQLTKP